MKIVRSLIIVLVMGAACISTANARDSFSLGINIGGYGYAPPPVVYYPAPAVVYYDEPAVYYRLAPRYYSYTPAVISFGYQNYGGYGYRDHHRDTRHHDSHRGWGHGGHGGWDRGGHDHHDRD